MQPVIVKKPSVDNKLDDDKVSDAIHTNNTTPSINKSTNKNAYSVVNDALHRYYTKKGKGDQFVAKGKSKFLLFLEEEEYASSDIDEELGVDADVDNCGILDFDKSFPFSPSIKDDNKRNEIFKILQRIHQTNTASVISSDNLCLSPTISVKSNSRMNVLSPTKPNMNTSKSNPIDYYFTPSSQQLLKTPSLTPASLSINSDHDLATPKGKQTTKPNLRRKRTIHKVKVSPKAFEIVDQELGKYYASQGRTDYFDASGTGLFMRFMDENGFEESELKEEFDDDAVANIDNNIFIDFDDHFPFPKSQANLTDKKKKEIEFHLIQNAIKFKSIITPRSIRLDYISKTGYPNNYNGMTLNKMDFNIDPDVDTKKHYKMYLKQCNLGFGQKYLTERGYSWCLSVGINNNFPFLQYLTDIYIEHSYKNDLFRDFNDNSYNLWVNKIAPDNVLDQQQKQNIAEGIDEYLRICPTVYSYSQLYGYKKSNIKLLAQYIVMSNQLIKDILFKSNNKTNTPFQLDFCISMDAKDVGSIPYAKSNSLNDDDYDGDIVYDYANVDDDDVQDRIGDIESKLKSNASMGVLYTKNTILPILTDLDSIKMMDVTAKNQIFKLCNDFIVKIAGQNKRQIFNFGQFTFQKNNIGNNNYADLCLEIAEIRIITLKWAMKQCNLSLFCIDQILFTIIDYELNDDDIPDLLNMTNKQSISNTYKLFENKMNKQAKITNYPLNQRFVAIVDQRNSKSENNIYWYSPPQDVNSIPKNISAILPEYYFNLSQKCLLPRVGYNIDYQKEMENTSKYLLKNQNLTTITAKSGTSGHLLILSYHVINENCVKLYLFKDGQCIRCINMDILIYVLFGICGYSRTADVKSETQVLQQMFSKLYLPDYAYRYFKQDIDKYFKKSFVI